MLLRPALQAVIYGAVLLSVLKAQEIRVSPKVWGYVGQDEVTLPCQFIQEQKAEVVLVQWSFQIPKGEFIKVVVLDVTHGLNINDNYTDKVYMKEYSLVIKNVDKTDAGEYSCALTTFPNGVFSSRTQLIVNEHVPLSAGAVSAIVITVLLLLGISTAAVYIILFRRHSCHSSPRNHISVDTQSSVRDPSRPSVLKREDMRTEVVYADVDLKPSSQKHVKTADVHVTYSEVKITRKKPETIMYSEVMQV